MIKEYTDFQASEWHDPRGFDNMITWSEYMKVYFVSTGDTEFSKEWAWMVADVNFHMPRSPMEWKKFHKMRHDS